MKIFGTIIGVLIIVLLYQLLNSGSSSKESILGVTDVLAGYEDYSQDLDFSSYDGKELVLFFHADRCSSCQAIHNDILEKGVPDGIQIFKVNFDSENELLQKYNVLTQSSFAQIDSSGELMKRRVGGFGIDDIVSKLETSDEEQPWKKIRKEQEANMTGDKIITEPGEIMKAYFAGGCFWCLEGPFESLDGVLSAVSGYAGGSKETATFKKILSGKTKHRESVEVSYDSGVIDYETLVQTYRYQIDPTDPGGQFADRGYQYTTAIYYQTEEEKSLAELSKKELDDSDKFEEKIVVLVEPFTNFFPAEEEHQDYYLKNSVHYNRYKKGSGRSGFIDENWGNSKEVKENIMKNTDLGVSGQPLSDLQRKVIFEQGTEPPFDNAYRDNKDPGIYIDILDGTPLFSSTDKFDSGTGRPSFTQPIDQSLLQEKSDVSFGMIRTEIETKDDTHLGHVFDDGPGGGKRYCINSAALDFVPLEKMEERGYAQYLVLFE